MAKVILLNLEDIANCSDLTDEEFGRLVRLLTEYQQTQTNPTLANEKGAVKMAFNFMKSFIDRQNAKYEAQCANGKKGGRPKKVEVEEKPTETQENLTKTKTKTKTNIEEKSIKRNVFVKPTVEEIKAYCEERKNHIDASKFFDYYEARNWELGKGRKVKDWKACVRTWEHNNFATDKGSTYQDVKPDWQTDEWLKEWEANLNV